MSKEKKKKPAKKPKAKSETTKKKRAAGGGRKPALDMKDPAILAQIELFGSLATTQKEMADWFGVCRETINHYMKDEDGLFFHTYKKAESKLKNNLRRAQVNKALKGDNTMLVWLGKNLLDQEDKTRVKTEEIPSVSDDELNEMSLDQATNLYNQEL